MQKVSNKNKYASKIKLTKIRSLIVIDNAPLRQKPVNLAQKWLKKIKETEQSTKNFQDVDLKLYTDWSNLTMHPLIEKIEKSREEFLQLAEFHNLMVTVATQKNIAMPLAFTLLMEEEEQYKNGDDKTRAKIDIIRAERTRLLEDEIKQQSKEKSECNCASCRQQRDQFNKHFSDGDDFESASEGLGANLFDEVINNFRTEEKVIQESREKYQSHIQYYERLTDKKLIKIMRNFEEGFDFLAEAFSVLMNCARTDLLRKIWRMAPVSLKTVINKKTKTDFKMSVEELMNESEERDQVRAQAIGAEESSLHEDDFGSDFFMGLDSQHKKNKKVLSEDDKIRIKSLFRKIVRRIHPDHLKIEASLPLKSWFDVLWKKVAEAHEKNDLEKLIDLHHKISIALNDYDELSISELETAANRLEFEYKDLLREYADFKNHPAWKFSQLKDYSKLQKAQAKPYLQQQKKLNKDIEEIRAQRAEIERIAGLIKDGKIKLRPAKQKRRTSQARQNIRRRQSVTDAQGTFFE